MSFVVDEPERICLAVAGTAALFPVRRVYCVGRNYAAHVVEMGGNPDRESPFFFQKNPENLVLPDGTFPCPRDVGGIHHEVELVVTLASGGRDIAVDDARACIFGYGVGVDFTCRDLQATAKAAGRPWTSAKAFEHSGPVSTIVPADRSGHPTSGRIWLTVDGVSRQEGDLGQMIWSVPEIIAALSRTFTLSSGDVIFTGTPSGVGTVRPGDRVECGVDGIATLSVPVI